MKKTVALIASCDTKGVEAIYMKNAFNNLNINTIVIDISIGLKDGIKSDIDKKEVFKSINKNWEEIKGLCKNDLFGMMSEAIKIKIYELYQKNQFDGIISMGGVQNTYIATAAMKILPLGIPKVIATTIACGKRSFDQVVGESDIVVIPSISDFTGLNTITEMSMMHAVDCMAGMLNGNEGKITKKTKKIIGVTLMGVTNKGAQAAINELERNGIEAIGFHSTGVGGAILDKLVSDKFIDGILDLNLHEISSEFFQGGFSFGYVKRLESVCKKDIPIIISPSGLDFIDYLTKDIPFTLNDRKYIKHNSSIAHIKINKKEAKAIGKLLGTRLSNSKNRIEMLVPKDGFRANTRAGEELFDPEIDNTLVDSIVKYSKGKVIATLIEGNADDENYGIVAALKMIDLLGGKYV